MERNNRKKYVHIDRETGSNEIFAMLDKTESETESDVENLLEDFDTNVFRTIKKKAINF